MARERDLDLVEVAPNAVPPVCRILDYGKFLYDQAKKERSAARQTHHELHEVRFKVKIGLTFLHVTPRRLHPNRPAPAERQTRIRRQG